MTAKALDNIDHIVEAAQRGRLRAQTPEQLAVWSRQLERMAQAGYTPGQDFTGMRVAVLGSFSTQHLSRFLRLFLLQERIWADVYEADFNAIEAEILREESHLLEFSPDFALIAVDHRFLQQLPSLFADQETVEAMALSEKQRLEALWETLHDRSSCHIIHNLYDLPPVSAIGNLDARLPFSERSFIHRVNSLLLEAAPSYVTLLDYDYIKSLHGRRTWTRPRNWYLHREGISLETLGSYSHHASRVIGSLTGRIRKCLVLDLDGTLWGGIVGEDGVDALRVDAGDPVGEAHLDFQQYVKRLKSYGVLLAVVSKNDPDVARLPFDQKQHMPLRREDFACFLANWEDKATNIRRVAEHLNIGVDSIAFFDDSPLERAWVEKELPEVAVVDVPEDPSKYVEALADSLLFETPTITAEDARRSEFYVEEEARNVLRSSLGSYEEFLQSLEMKVTCAPVTAANMDRVVQLLARTNQFNVRTERHTKGEVEEIILSDGAISMAVELEDRFGSHGIISAVIAVPTGEGELFVDSWVLSCRAFNRGVEEVISAALAERALHYGYRYIIGEYRPTDRNKVVAELYQRLGYERCGGLNDRADTTWRFDLGRQNVPATQYHSVSLEWE